MEESFISETPWAWYLVRSSGITALIFLYIAMFLGLAIKTPGLKDIIRPIYSVGAHCWLASQVLFFSIVHLVGLIFDQYLDFGPLDILIPFYTDFEPGLVSLGILGFYLIVILVGTSYFRQAITWKFWRKTHYLYIVLFPVAFIHSFYLGTDLKSPVARAIFLIPGGILALLFITKLFFSNRLHRT